MPLPLLFFVSSLCIFSLRLLKVVQTSDHREDRKTVHEDTTQYIPHDTQNLQKDFLVNKIFLGLTAAIILLGAAFVLTAPDPAQKPRTELPALPDLAAERAARNADLTPLPQLPDRVEGSSTVRAPVSGPETARAAGTGSASLTAPVTPPAGQASQTAAARSAETGQAKVQARVEAPVQTSAAQSGRAAGAPAAEAQAKPVTTAAGKAEARTETSAAAKPGARADSRPAARAEAQPESTSEGKSEGKTKGKSGARPAATAQAKAVEKPEAKAEAKAESRAQAQAEAARSDAKAEAVEKPEAKAGAKAESRAQAGTDAKPETKTDAKAEAKAERPRMVVFARDKGATVRLTTGRTITYRQMLLENPWRVVIDVTGEYKNLRAPGIPDNTMVSNVRLGHYTNRTRIVVDLKSKPAGFRTILSEDRDRLDIRVDK